MFDFDGFANRRIVNPLFSSYKFSKIKHKDFSIISNNCLAGTVYKQVGSPFTSPTIGLFFWSKDYIKFLENLEYYLSLPLKFGENTKMNYPLGTLGDLDVHFLHYKTQQEAAEKWGRRKQRINFNNLFVTYCDEGTKEDSVHFEEDYFNRFVKLPFKNKLFFSTIPRESKSDCVVITHDWGDIRGRKYQKSFDAVKWLNKENDFIKKKYCENDPQKNKL